LATHAIGVWSLCLKPAIASNEIVYRAVQPLGHLVAVTIPRPQEKLSEGESQRETVPSQNGILTRQYCALPGVRVVAGSE
jgi:hypothetical protein